MPYKTISIRLPPEALERIDKIRSRDGLKRGEVIRGLVLEGLRNREAE